MKTLPPISICKAFDNRELELILLPTEQCNFRCFYCYEKFNIGMMKDPILTGVKNLISNRISELDRLTISWFGGEPLLGLKVIQDISSHIVSLITKTEIDVNYTSNMTTNGYLLNLKTFKELTDLGIRSYQISLDGDQQVHDKTRVNYSQEGTFEKIWSNLIEISKTDIKFEILLRIHYFLDTWENLDSLIQKINDSFSSDNRFRVFFKPIARLGGKNDREINIVTDSEKTRINKLLLDKLSNKKQFKMFNFEEEYICYAAKANSFVIRANGEICKCTVALYDERNTVGFLNEDGTLSINQKRFRPWIQGLLTQERDTLLCPAPKVLQS